MTGALCALRELGVPIGPKVSRPSNIMPEMVAGHAVDLDAVSDMLLGAYLLFAYNAAFRRPFCKALRPAFSRLP